MRPGTIYHAKNGTLNDCYCSSGYWMELATFENTLLAFEPTSRIVPTTRTKMTASITAYSAIS